jgi:hypothetical protein
MPQGGAGPNNAARMAGASAAMGGKRTPGAAGETPPRQIVTFRKEKTRAGT